MRLIAEIKHTNQDGDWFITLERNDICFNKDGEIRIYDLKTVERYEQKGDYLLLYCEDGTYYQVKFEVDNFLVIDYFDANNELIDEIGAHVFGEE